jgi:hypothetical protein
MAKYSGMTYGDIINFACTIAKKNRMPLEYQEAESVINECLKQVAEDIFEANKTHQESWPSSEEIDLDTAEIMWPAKVFGDATPFSYIDYEGFRELFLGDESQKPESDYNYYYTVLDRTLYLEPDLTGFTNVVIMNGELEEEYAVGGASNSPILPAEYRVSVSYKICELLCPSNKRSMFRKLYRDERNRARSLKNRKLAEGGAEFWDPFQGSDSYRQSGWPGSIED